jgi:E3 Ubiquitin ligase
VFNPYYFWVLTLGAGGILTGLYIFFRRWRWQRLVEDTPQARIRSAPQGFVKLSGRAQAVDGKPLRAPLSGRRCVWWTFRVEQRRRNGRAVGFGWSSCDSGTSDQPFILADGNDHCLVYPQGAEVEASERKVWYGASPDDVPLALQGGMNVGFGQSCRYVEAVLTEDTELAVLGDLRANTGSLTNASEDEAAVLLEQWKHNQKALLARFDADHDGRIDATEWEAARAAALIEARQNKIQQAPEQRVSVLAKPRNSQPFLIAALSAGQLARTERWRALAGLAITMASLIITCYAIAVMRSIEDGSRSPPDQLDSR